MKRMLIKNGIIVTLEHPNRVLANHAVLIEGGLIKKIVPQRSTRNLKAQVIDAHGKVVMPGFVNAHTHFYSSFARGLTKAEPARNFTEILRNLWWRLDRRLTLEDCYYSALVAGLESIRHGTTTVIDHHASPYAVKGSLTRIAQAVQELGLRACLCYEVSDRDGEDIAREAIEENLRFMEQCRQVNNNQLKALFGLHASFTLGEKTFRKCAEMAGKYQAGFHIHCAEDVADQTITRSSYGKNVVQRLSDHGILGPRTVCAHAVHLDDDEWDRLAQSQTAVVHNPQSNLNNAVGVMDLLKATRKGVLVGLGTDAMTSNMREELRSAIWAQRLSQKDPSAALGEAVGLLIRNNQEISNRYFQKVGQLREGWNADLICVDYFPPTRMNEDNFPAHLVFGLSQAIVDTTIVGGRILMKNKRLLHLDEESIAGHSQKLSAALWKRF
ncbi:MAG: putative aminohydrolase SsnA [Acidobacteriia bacterium]|nr:putative aminohydrolase SsnA [Terriglobia bacterium]